MEFSSKTMIQQDSKFKTEKGLQEKVDGNQGCIFGCRTLFPGTIFSYSLKQEEFISNLPFFR